MHNFSDARQTAYNPEDHELANLEAGDCVKVCHNAERFWVTITANSSDHKVISGTIANGLVNEQPFGFGDHVTFSYHNVYQFNPNANKRRSENKL